MLLKIGWSKIRHILGSCYLSGGNCRDLILDFQIKAADRFITQAKRLNRKKVILIHGKGKGVLKNKIKELIQQHKLTSEYSDFNSGETIIKL